MPPPSGPGTCFNISMVRSLFAAACLACTLSAEVVRLEVHQRADVLAGKSFGKSGPYERLSGRAYFAVDPKLPANQIIRDIDRAPRNEKGMVEFSADFYVLKPRDPANGNGAVLYEVSNRGNKGMLAMFNRAAASRDPLAEKEFGDGFLLEQGYMLLWLGWQFDVPRTEGLMRLYAPVATDEGRAITGLVRSEFIPDAKTTSFSLGDRNHIPYAPAGAASDVLTVRDHPGSARRVIPRDQWKFVENTHVSMESGFEPGKIYEAVYTAKDPALVGLGPTGIRDMVSFLKYGIENGVTPLSDHRRYIKRAYGFGVSQSGRFLRTFLYFGFNADEKGRQVFDGVMAHVAGGGRGSFNHRFAQPSRDGHPYMNLFYPTDIFPFTDLDETDADTGLTDGILDRVKKDNVTPKIFYTNSSYEYWGRAASLIHTSLDGKKDAPLPPTSRVYLFAGGQHGPAGFPPVKGHTQYLPNSNPFTWGMRALLTAMDRWVREGKEPPPSLYPRLDAKQLVPPDELKFPRIAGVHVADRTQKAYRVDYGPAFRDKGIVSIEPPVVGRAFPTLVPQVDVDGNESAGIRMPGIQVPLGSYTGWNLRSPDIGAPDELFSMVGSFFSFPLTRADRARSKDPRASIEERYPSKQDYLAKVEAATKALAQSGYLLERDVPSVVAHSSAEWDWVANGSKK
jgi:alpha/beta hydrolase family protein